MPRRRCSTLDPAAPAGQCYDEMNRAVWVVSLNTIMQIDAVGDAFLLPQGAFDKITPPIYERHVRALFCYSLVYSLGFGLRCKLCPK